MIVQHWPMQGRVCVVTGATDGIGRETAAGLMRLGATVCGIARDRDKAARVAAELRRDVPGGSLEFLIADLSDMVEVRRLADAITARYPQVHVLINNAGALFPTRRLTRDGFEMTLALNYLAPFLLTHRISAALLAAAPARVINVSSSMHAGGRINFEDLHAEHDYKPWVAYASSKLALVLFTYELARCLAGTGVTANAVHPGVVRTAFFGSSRDYGRLSAAEGAEPLIYLATSPDLATTTGRYFDRLRAAPSSGQSQDRSLARRLWETTAALLGLETTLCTARPGLELGPSLR